MPDNVWDSSFQGSLLLGVRNTQGAEFASEEGALIPVNLNGEGRLQTIAKAEGGQSHIITTGTEIVKEGPGVLRGLLIVSWGLSSTLNIWDGDEGDKRLLPQIGSGFPVAYMPNLILQFEERLTIVSSSQSAISGAIIFD